MSTDVAQISSTAQFNPNCENSCNVIVIPVLIIKCKVETRLDSMRIDNTTNGTEMCVQRFRLVKKAFFNSVFVYCQQFSQNVRGF